MKLTEVFDHLTYGELSQLNLTQDIDGESGVKPDNRYRLITHINLGLTELHKRFFLREGRHEVFVTPGIQAYSVYVDDLLKIEKLIDDKGEELELNRGDFRTGARTSSFNAFELGQDVVTSKVTVVYRANHPVLSPREAEREPDRVEVHLPRTHLNALLLFIASRIVNPMGFSGEGMHEGNNYAAKFEQACIHLENGGYRITQEEERPRIQRMGWV